MTEEKGILKSQGENEMNAIDSGGGDEDSSNCSSNPTSPRRNDNEVNSDEDETKDATDRASPDDNEKGNSHSKISGEKSLQDVQATSTNDDEASGENRGSSPAVSESKGNKTKASEEADSSKDRKRALKKKKKNRDRESMELEWKQERYDKLLYMAKKDMMKHIKQTKTFVCQKLIRKLKQQQQQQEQQHESSQENQHRSSDAGGIDKLKKRSKVEDEMKSYKSLNNDSVVQEAVRRLGLIALNPSWTPNTDDSGNNATEKETLQANKEMVETILKHKKMESCLEQWNEKVTEYRRWCLRRAEIAASKRQNGGPSVVFTEDLYRSNKDKKRKNRQQQQNQATSNKRHRNDNDHQSSMNLTDSSVFCSLGGADGSDNDEDYDMDPESRSAYGPGGDEYYQQDGGKKKNRQGQRARRAKALAMQAKQEGRKYESTNWRPKKTPDDQNGNEESAQNHQQRRDHRPNNRNDPQSRQANSSYNQDTRHQQQSYGQQHDYHQQKSKQQETKDAAQHHPSWAAKQAQSTGIVAFQGKKITFD